MYITLNIPGALAYLFLGWHPPSDADNNDLIGLSTVAFLAMKDPGHVFIPVAELHDAVYSPGSSMQIEVDQFGDHTWPRWRADLECFLKPCLYIAKNDINLIKEAQTLYLCVREFYTGTAWQGIE